MRVFRKAGLAGMPGFALNERERRHLALRLRVHQPGLGSAPCTDCGASDKPVDTEQGIAVAMARVLGANDLVTALNDPRPSKLMQRAGVLAAATAEVMKFRKDSFAVLAGITSPEFANVVQKTAKKLNQKGQKGLITALTIGYLNGAIDDAAGRNTPLARDYRKALRDLQEALSTLRKDPRFVKKALPTLSGLSGAGDRYGSDDFDSVAVWNLDGLGRVIPGGLGITPVQPEKSEPLKPSDPKWFRPPARKKDLSDLGTATRLPDALDFVPFDRTLTLLWGVVGSTYAQSISTIRKWAEKHKTAVSDKVMQGAAERAASWIIRNADDATLQSVAKEKHDEFRFKRNVGWITLTSRYGVRAKDIETDASAFEKYAAKMLASGAKQAVARTGQTGAYNADGTWAADAGSKQERVPNGPESLKYVGTFNELSVDPKPRPSTIFLAQDAYQLAYRKEPTLQALNWYGSFGYGVWFGSYFGLRAPSVNQNETYVARVGELEAVRMSGAAVPPQDAQNNTNVFLSAFNVMGPGLSLVLDAINKGTEAANETVCALFKVLAGPEVGGILCRIFDAILKFYTGVYGKQSAALLIAVGKALLGFLGKLSNGDWLGALYELFAGVNTAVVFALGGVFANVIGVPFAKTEERPEKDPRFIPSLERMADELLRDDPLFLVLLAINITALVIAPSPTNIAALVSTLAPVVALTIAPSVQAELKRSKEKWIEPYKALPINAIRQSITSLIKLLSGVAVGILKMKDAMAVIGDRAAKFVEKEGGSGPATVKALQFFLMHLQESLRVVILDIGAAFQNPDRSAFQVLAEDIKKLLVDSLLLLPLFAEETGTFDKSDMDAVRLVATTGASTVDQAYDAYNAIVENLDAAARAEVAMRIAEDKPAKTTSYRRPKAKKPAIDFTYIGAAAAAGILVGLLLNSGKGAKA